MKKFLMVVVLAVVLMGAFYPQDAENITQYADGKVSFYFTGKQTTVQKSIKSGAHNIVQCEADDAKRFAKQLGDFDGFSFLLSATDKNSTDTLLKKIGAFVVSKQKIGEISITYAYNPRFAKSVLLKGEKVNVQVAVSEGVMTVGYPLILGSY